MLPILYYVDILYEYCVAMDTKSVRISLNITIYRISLKANY